METQKEKFSVMYKKSLSTISTLKNKQTQPMGQSEIGFGIHDLDSKWQKQMESFQQEITELRGNISQQNEKMAQQDEKMAQLDEKIDKMNQRLGLIEVRHLLNQFRDKVWLDQTILYDDYLETMNLDIHPLSDQLEALKITSQDLKLTRYRDSDRKTFQEIGSESAHQASEESLAEFITAIPYGRDRDVLCKIYEFVFGKHPENVAF